MTNARIQRGLFSVIGLTFVMACGTWLAAAQEPKSAPASADSAPSSAKRSNDPARRVPPYFGQIGLTASQRDEIYKIRAKHQEKIDALEKQIAEARAQVLAECETLLTDSQMKLLEQHRRTASEARKSRASAKSPSRSSTSSN
jgi:hypothetical protein